MDTFPLIATAAAGLEAVVVRELRALGYADAKTRSTGRVVFQGDRLAIAAANLHLYTAERVLVELGRFEATDFGQLFDQTFALPWEEWLPADAAFPVNGRSVKSQLSSVPACQRIVKKAIVEKLCQAHHVQTLTETGPPGIVEVALLEDRASLTLDTTGEGLHKRGYRSLSSAAPLRETLAAALVMLTFWEPERPLIDPFCGSGTIAIEAAMIGRRIAPGLRRSFAAERWPGIDSSVWSQVRRVAADRVLDDLPERIMATDIDADVLSLARHHAQQAGVADDIHFQQADFADLTSSRRHGCLITNPPYGERIGEQQDVDDLYRVLPLVLRKLPTWSFYILTNYPAFETIVDRPADRRRKLYNGRLECTYFQFHGPRPPRRPADQEAATDQPAITPADDATSTPAGEIVPRPPAAETGPVFGGLDAKARSQAELFASRLRKTARHLRRWPTRRGTTCYRLYDRDIPEIPLMVERYEDHLHIAEYERPHDRSAAEHADWMDLMVRTAADVLDARRKNVYVKRRERQRGFQQYEKAAEQRHRLLVREGSLTFEVNLADYIDTGLFLDHRITRSKFGELAADRDVVNLFCYTGAFTVYAAAAGARSTTSVDLSHTYLQWAQRNLEHNQLEGPQHVFIRSDVLSFLDSHTPGACYDLAIVDPPTFSNSKATSSVWDIQRDQVELLQRLLRFMRPGGQIFFSTNSRRFKLDVDTLVGVSVHEITRQTIPEDFRNRRIHRCWVITVDADGTTAASTKTKH